MPLYKDAPEFAKPTPAHQLSDTSVAAAQALLEVGRARRVVPPMELVTEHPQPWRQIELSELPSAARRFADKAVAAGRTVAARQAGDCVCVGVRAGVYDDGLASSTNFAPSLRIYWTRGRNTGALLAGRKVSVAEAVALL